MRIYVDELPKSCAKCELCSHIFTNCLPNLYKCAVDGHARFAEYKVEDEEPCPLQPLADYTKQVRKEVCEEIRKKIGKNLIRMCPDGEYGSQLGIGWCDLNRVIDQIQGDKVE